MPTTFLSGVNSNTSVLPLFNPVSPAIDPASHLCYPNVAITSADFDEMPRVAFSEGCGKGLPHVPAITAVHAPRDARVALLRSLFILFIPRDGKLYPTK